MYQFEPEVLLNHSKLSDLTPTQRKEFAESCPTKVYKYDEEADTVEVEDALRCMFCNECKKKAEDMGFPDLVTIRTKQDEDPRTRRKRDRFHFTVEVRKCWMEKTV
jgi:DNA-directed RNA polymerase II subunit RPB3